MPVVDHNGARLWYDEAGSGPAILLLHGGLGDSGLWEPVVPFLAEQFRTIRTDLRFFGRSVGPAVPWSWQEDAVGVLDELGIGRAGEGAARRARRPHASGDGEARPPGLPRDRPTRGGRGS